MIHDLLIPRILAINLGDEAGAQIMRRQPLEAGDRELGLCCPPQENLPHRGRVQRLRLDIAPAVDLAEHRAEAAAARLQPGLERPHRVGLGLVSARDAELGPLPRGVGFAARDRQPEALRGEADMLARDGDQLGPAQRAGIAEQQPGAVAQVGEAAGVAGGDQQLDLWCGEGCGPASRGISADCGNCGTLPLTRGKRHSEAASSKCDDN